MIRELDEFNLHPTMVEVSGLALIFFTGPDCASCHHLRDLLVHEKQQFNDAFINFSVFEIKADRASSLVNEFGVFHLPSMFLYRGGVFHCELHAEAHPQKIIDAITDALSKPAQEEP
ncbi:MAG: thioredoxin family protein [Cocleimonas sp.]